MKDYWATCLEPVHVGTGEYQLGRVDNTIVREPATGIPKIPATSLAGIFRAYSGLNKPAEDEFFGWEKRPSSLIFSDARVVLFPIRASVGTAWITTEERLMQTGISLDNETSLCHADNAYMLKNGDTKSFNQVALGWIYLDVVDKTALFRAQNVFSILPEFSTVFAVSDKLYYHLVNDNLEVRTSVRIDKETGTAHSGALFTSESLPRGTVMHFTIHQLDSSGERFKEIFSSVNANLNLTGLGGMRTRGFGRLRLSEAKL